MKKQMVLVFSFALAACGGDDGGGGGGGGGTSDAAMAQPLTCKSIALCTTYDVKTFIGTVPAPAGGTVSDGIYRLQYAMDPSGIGEDPSYFEGLDALQIRGNAFNWAGFHRDDIGTFTTNGSMITFQATQMCERGMDGISSTQKIDYKYTATATELRIFTHIRRSDGTEWDRMYVYVKTSDPQEVCSTVSGDPASPGNSARCNVTNCACNFAVEGTVNECT